MNHKLLQLSGLIIEPVIDRAKRLEETALRRRNGQHGRLSQYLPGNICGHWVCLSRTKLIIIRQLTDQSSFLFGYDSGVMTDVIASEHFLEFFDTNRTSPIVGAINSTFSGGAVFGSLMGGFTMVLCLSRERRYNYLPNVDSGSIWTKEDYPDRLTHRHCRRCSASCCIQPSHGMLISFCSRPSQLSMTDR